MKALLMSIRPKWVAKILNGEKTIEIRKKFPKDYVGWVYIYCTKTLPLLLKNKDSGKIFINKLKAVEKDNLSRLPHIQKFNGKVVARFWCDKVEEIIIEPFGEEIKDCEKEWCEKSCLSFAELNNYLKGKLGYAIHITKLEIFDEPKEISEFIQSKRKNYEEPQVQKAPQSWCYIEI